MKKLLLVLSLIVGVLGLVHAGGRDGNGWVVTTVTGTTANIGSVGRSVFINKIFLSSGPTTGDPNFAMVFTTVPSAAANGAEGTLFGGTLFQSTQALTPALVFLTTTTLGNSQSQVLNNLWNAGDCDSCYIQTRADGQVVVRKSAAASGGANVLTIHWSQ